MGNYVLQIANYKLITHYQLSIELPQESVADAMNTERCVMKKKYLMCALVSIALLERWLRRPLFLMMGEK